MLTLRIVVDHCLVEVFAQGGKAVLTDLVFPRVGSKGSSVFTASGTAILRKLAVAAAGLTCGVPLLPSASRYAQRELLRSTVRELLRTVYS